MKIERDIHTQSAGMFSFNAILDARLQNAIGKTHFSDKELLFAGRVLMALCDLYNNDFIESNYRRGKQSSCGTYKSRFIAIKMKNPRVRDKKALTSYEKGLDIDTAYRKVEKIKNPRTNSVIYRLYF